MRRFPNEARELSPAWSRRLPSLGLVAGMLVVSARCTALQQLAALRQVDFSLAGAVNPRVAGVDLTRVRSYSDLSAVELARLALAVAGKDVPLEFTLNVRAENPRDNTVTARMIRLQWTLLLQNKETVNGSVDQGVSLPPGEPQIVPVFVKVNLLQFFDGTVRDLIDLALAAVGTNPNPVTIALRAVPTIDTPIGPISYPEPITVVSRTL